MARPYKSEVLTRRTDADLSAEEWTLVKVTGDNDMDICGAGQLAFGALTEDVADGSSTAVHLPVQVGPFILVKCGGAITGGTLAMSDASGEAVACTTGNYSIGQAMETYADGDVGLFQWAPSYYEEG